MGALSSLPSRLGEFFAYKAHVQGVPWNAPSITVAGVGRLGLPLCSEQAAALVAATAGAPGQGAGAPVVVPAAGGPLTVAWGGGLVGLRRQIEEALGLEPEDLEEELIALVLYPPGSCYLPLLGASPAAFGTLLLQLPSEHAGGALTVSCGGRPHQADLATGSADRIAALAFFTAAGCSVAAAPVASGYRLALHYSLTSVAAARGARPLPQPTDLRPAQRALAAAATAWAADPRAQQLAVLPLEEPDAEAQLCFEGLRGRDAVVAEALRGAARGGAPAVELFLVRFVRTETVSAPLMTPRFLRAGGTQPLCGGADSITCVAGPTPLPPGLLQAAHPRRNPSGRQGQAEGGGRHDRWIINRESRRRYYESDEPGSSDDIASQARTTSAPSFGQEQPK